jgi:hypothetical protein
MNNTINVMILQSWKKHTIDESKEIVVYMGIVTTRTYVCVV